ncbi:hypothetical protein ABIE78_002917 [Sinorhizobium fredii]
MAFGLKLPKGKIAVATPLHASIKGSPFRVQNMQHLNCYSAKATFAHLIRSAAP